MVEQPQSPPNLVQGFKGLNTRIDPTRLGLEYQLQADNVLCDDAGYLIRRPGTQALASGFKDVYGTRNGRLLAITTSDDLIELNELGDFVHLHSGVTGGPFQWAELGYAFFLQSPTASWAVYPNRLLEWGSLCPTSSVDTFPLGDPISYPPPTGEVICARRSQMVVGVWEPDRDRSVLYFSRPDFPHEFRLQKDFILIPGRITMLASLSQGLVIGTDRAIFTDPIDSPIQRVADYGVPVGAMAHDDLNRVYFWTERGLCAAFPFQNLTDTDLTVSLREGVTVGVLPYQGSTYIVVSQSGALVNKRLTQPYVPMTIDTTHENGVTI